MRHNQGTAADPPGSTPTPQERKGVPQLTRVHKLLIGVVVVGAAVIAGIGFAGSYAAVRELAEQKGFGDFSLVFPIGIDAGIVVLLGLDLLLTWIRIPFPLLRQTAWLLTAATIAFNGAAAWPDPLGVGMHAVIPVLFVVAVEAARHAVGRIADITADKHMEGVRLTRWLLSPVPTFRLWRRMKLWEVREYEAAVSMEQARLIYQARLEARFGRAWRRKAPVEALMPLRLAKYGVPIAETAPAGLAAAGIPLPAELERVQQPVPELVAEEVVPAEVAEHHGQDETRVEEPSEHPELEREPEQELQYEAYGPVPEPYRQFPAPGRLAAAGGPLAARDTQRPHVVQARIDSADRFQKDPELVLDEASSDVPGPFVPGPAVEPEPILQEVVDEAVDEEESSPEPEPELTGVALLEHRYLQLPPEQRFPNQSASALARALHEGTGYTEGTARKYLRGIIAKHA